MNDAAASGTKVPLKAASRLATSVPERLLCLKAAETQVSLHQHMFLEQDASLHELLRVCMLAYVKMLLIKLPGIGRKMTVLADGLRAVLTSWHIDIQFHCACDGSSPPPENVAGI